VAIENQFSVPAKCKVANFGAATSAQLPRRKLAGDKPTTQNFHLYFYTPVGTLPLEVDLLIKILLHKTL